MVKEIFIGLFIIGLCSCSSEKSGKKDNTPNKIVEKESDQEPAKNNLSSLKLGDFYQFSSEYMPNHLGLDQDLNDTLNFYNIDSLYQYGNKDSMLLISKILLLKLCLYHLQRANQGYDLYMMRNGSAKTIIDFYIKNTRKDFPREFLNSEYIWGIEKEHKQNDTLVKSLISKINMEEKRIIRQSKQYINQLEDS